MTRKNQSEFDDSTEQGDEKGVRLETAEDKAIEALKHTPPEKDCDVTVRVHNRERALSKGA